MANVWYQDQKEVIDSALAEEKSGVARYMVAEYKREEMNKADPSLLDSATAAFAVYNPITSYIVNDPLPNVPSIDGYNPFENEEIAGYENYWQAFMDSTNPETTVALKGRIDREMRNREILNNTSGIVNLATTVAATLGDPFNLALLLTPGGLLARGGKFGASALRSGAAGVAATGATEATLFATQETREADEAVFNLVVTAAADSLLGGAFGKWFTEAEATTVRESVTRHFAGEPPLPVYGPRTLSAAQAGGEATGNEIKRARAFFKYTGMEWLGRAMARATPRGNLAMSPNQETRRVSQEMLEQTMEVEGDFVPTSAQTLMKGDLSKADVVIGEVDALHRASGLSVENFDEAISSAMRRGDLHTNPQVQEAAQKIRASMDDMLELAANERIQGAYMIEKGLDGEDVYVPIQQTTAASYLTRMYDQNLVATNPTAFKAAWREGITAQMVKEGRGTAEGKVLAKEGRKALRDGKKLYKQGRALIRKGDADEGNRLIAQAQELERAGKTKVRGGKEMPDDDEWDEILDDIYKNVRNLRDGDTAAGPGVSGSGMFKKRAQVEDQYLEAFLVKDWRHLYTQYTKNMSGRIRLAQKFGQGDGDFEMTSVFKQMEEQNDVARIAAEDAGDTKLAAQIQRQYNKDVRNLKYMRDAMLGRSMNPSVTNPSNQLVVTMLRTLRGWNQATMLNGVVLASIPDTARVMVYNGGKRFAPALARSLEALPLDSVPKDQLTKIVQASERVSNARINQYSDIEDAMPLSKAEAIVRKVSDKAMTISGIKHWNTLWKGVVATMANDRMVIAVREGADAAWLKSVGVGGNMAEDVITQIKRHSTHSDGLWSMNVDQWTSREAVETVEAAIIKEADRVVLTPDIADRPLLTNGEVAKSIFQFKGFIMAAANRQTMPMMQAQGGRGFAEIMALTSMGALGYYASQLAVGRTPSDDPLVILREAIDRTGMTAYALELYNVGNKIAGDPLGTEPTRYRSRDKVGALLGPTAGTASNIFKAIDANTSVDSRIHAGRVIMPLQNHFIFRRGLDYVEGNIAKSLGGTGKYATPRDRGSAVKSNDKELTF